MLCCNPNPFYPFILSHVQQHGVLQTPIYSFIHKWDKHVSRLPVLKKVHMEQSILHMQQFINKVNKNSRAVKSKPCGNRVADGW